MKSDKIKEFATMVHLLSNFFIQKGGKIQTGLNCEYDGLSEVILTLPHSRKFTKKFGNKVINRQYFRRKTGLKFSSEIA